MPHSYLQVPVGPIRREKWAALEDQATHLLWEGKGRVAEKCFLEAFFFGALFLLGE